MISSRCSYVSFVARGLFIFVNVVIINVVVVGLCMRGDEEALYCMSASLLIGCCLCPLQSDRGMADCSHSRMDSFVFPFSCLLSLIIFHLGCSYGLLLHGFHPFVCFRITLDRE